MAKRFKTPKRKMQPRRLFFRKRTCIFCAEKAKDIDYKDLAKLTKFISERGKMGSRRRSGVCAKHQRKLACAIKRARYIALLPFIKR